MNSIDPNSKIGPAGYGPQAFVSPANPFPYHIDFENSPTASAPAQRVDITDQLDPNLNWSTFQWTGFGFGDTIISIPPNTQHYETTVPMTYDGVTFRVDVTLDIDPATGMVHASFQSLNAANLMTGLATCPGTLSLGPANREAELPPPVTIGFLPPEDGTGRGMGYITYTVKPKSGLATGTQIRNVADVTFDLGNTIATDQVSETDPSHGVDPTKQALVTIDAVAPTSTVAVLPSYVMADAFTVAWSGTDDPGGSGIGSYTIYVSEDGGPFTPWLAATTQTSATFTGVDGDAYRFFAQATDNAGNQEALESAAEATTIVDATPPSSTVSVLPTFSTGAITLKWSGSDLNGIGIASYDLYMSDNGGSFRPLLTGTTETSTTFTGANGHIYGFYSVATDHLGRVQPTPASAQTTTVVALTPPSQPPPAVTVASDDSGTKGDGITDDATPAVAGTTEPDATVQLRNGTQVLGTATADASGHYRVSPQNPLSPGTYHLTVVASNPLGSSDPSEPLSLTIVAPPATPSAPTLLPADSNGSPDGETTAQPRPSLTGTALAGATVQLLDSSGTVLNTTRADGSGTYQVQVPGPLGLGSYSFRVAVVDQYGDISSPSAAATITVVNGNGVNPEAPLVTVKSLQLKEIKVGKGKRARKESVLVLQFSGSLESSSADNSSAYRIAPVIKVHARGKGRHRQPPGTKLGNPVTPASAVYADATHEVTLMLRGNQKRAKPQELVVIGSVLTDMMGRQVDGNGDGQQGGSYIATIRGSQVTKGGLPLARPRERTAMVPAAIDALLARGELASAPVVHSGSGTPLRLRNIP